MHKNEAVSISGFYAALAAGDSLGEASRHARVAAGRDHDDPAWLAYSVYGDPAAQATGPASLAN